MGVPEVDEIDGLPPAVALQQQRGSPTTRSSVGSVTTLSNLLRMLYSRAGDYPRGQAHPLRRGVLAEHAGGRLSASATGWAASIEVTEASMVPDDSLTIRERAIAAWPPAWHGQNLRDILVTLGYDVDTPWRDLPKKDRDWILFTDEQPAVPVYAGYTPAEVRRALKRKEEPSYQGNFSSARRYVLQTFATTESASMKKRVAQYMVSSECPLCHGKRLRRESLSVTFAGVDIADISRHAAEAARRAPAPVRERRRAASSRRCRGEHPEKAVVAQRIAPRISWRGSTVLLDLGLGYLALERSTPTLVARRAAAPAARDAGAIESVRRRLRARRAVSRAASGRHRSAVARARSAEGVGQLAVRRRARARRHPAR